MFFFWQGKSRTIIIAFHIMTILLLFVVIVLPKRRRCRLVFSLAKIIITYKYFSIQNASFHVCHHCMPLYTLYCSCHPLRFWFLSLSINIRLWGRIPCEKGYTCDITVMSQKFTTKKKDGCAIGVPAHLWRGGKS
jgi:hypothetical protein